MSSTPPSCDGPTQAKIWALLLLLSILQALATFLFLFQFTAGQTYA